MSRCGGTGGGMGIVAGAVQVPAALIDASWTIGLLVTVGYVSLGLRYVVLAGAPWLAEHATVVVYLIDGAVNLFSLAWHELAPIVHDIISTVKLLTELPAFIARSGHPSIPSFELPAAIPNNWHLIKPEAVRAFMVALPVRCGPYDNIATIVGRSLRSLLSPYVCPLIRFTYPVPWMWRASNAVLGWLSYEAEPMGAHVLGGRPNNCEVPFDGVDWVCVSLGSGFVVMEILLPLFLISLLGGLLLVPIIEKALVGTKFAVKEAGKATAAVVKTTATALGKAADVFPLPTRA